MRILLIGETGMGKTVTALTLSQFFNTTYVDTEEGTLLWLKSQFNMDKSKFKLILIDKWFNFSVPSSELIVLDSLSTLMEHYQDYLQSVVIYFTRAYVREKGEVPMPTATGIMKLRICPQFVVLPMQLYQLLYDTMINVVDNVIRNSEHCIITMHPIETQQLSIDGKIIESHSRKKFVQSIYRRMDVILQYVKPMQCNVVKCRGKTDVNSVVNPIEFLKELMEVIV